MKILTNEDIITIVSNCKETNSFYCDTHCPLFLECLHYYTGDNCNSALEKED